MLLLAFFMLRFFGQGSMMMASQTPINYWWVSNRGAAPFFVLHQQTAPALLEFELSDFTSAGSRMGIAGAATSLFMMGVIPPLMYADG
eukprot:SAG11_NODE_7196_length_1179_cov_1.850000_1_plen_87_part_01